MRLELRWSDVDELVAGSATRLAGKRLEVNLDGLRTHLSADARLAGIRLEAGRRRGCPSVAGGVAKTGHGQTLALGA
jgi:hypothetical protein